LKSMSEGKTPSIVPERGKPLAPKSDGAAIDAFIQAARTVANPTAGQGRIILALDATMSRQATWDLACSLQGEMFDAAGKAGNLSVQLAYFRGLNESRTSKFVTDTETLKRLMERITCAAGETQIGRILSHTVKETRKHKVDALVFIGDSMEENVDRLADDAAALGLAGTPVFVFQEGRDGAAEVAFREIARLSRGAWFRFDQSSARTLANLLSSIAVFATGGLAALEARGRDGDRLLLQHLGGGR
jgi:hypothetical protein